MEFMYLNTNGNKHVTALWLYVQVCYVNIVLLKELRSGIETKHLLQPYLKLNSVRNRNRQDVESLAELGCEPVLDVLKNVKDNTCHRARNI